ncbi:MAG: hypothetical protein ACK4WD_02760 [Flavobacteriales bacterium]|jgi:hypothetical protein
MLKTLIVLINFIGLFFLHLFTVNEVAIQNVAPDSMKPGEKTLVEVTIYKNQIQGFGKMEIQFPEGFVASPSETKGASFTFSERKARFVWMTMPTEETFTVSYFLEAPATFDGRYEVKGIFSYIKENERVDYLIPTKSVMVKPDAAVATNQENGSNTNTSTNGTDQNSSGTSATASNTSNTSETAPETTSSNSSSEFRVERSITKLTDTEYRVNIRVLNSNVKGFAKIIEGCPNLSKTEKIQDAGATVTADKNNIKFVWFEIPVSPLIEVAYKLTLLSPSSQLPEINGKIAFVENNNPKEIVIVNVAGAAANTDSNAVATNPANGNTTNESKSNSNTATENTAGDNTTTATNKNSNTNTSSESTASNVTKTQKNDPVKEEKSKVKENVKPVDTAENKTEKSSTSTSKESTKSNGSKVSSAPDAEKGVTYKVQILAAHRVVNKTYFKQRHGFSEDFNIENHEGWVKYTTGKFGEYKTARDERERLKSDYNTLPGPFVTAYNNGDRITVQEALLISKQQWYQ